MSTRRVVDARAAASDAGLARIRVGTAGWALPREHRAGFPLEGSNLERYAARLDCAEINSSFYRPHRPSTYERWGATVPADFRFAVKVPRAVTHERKLVGTGPTLDAFLAEAGALGDRLGCVLVQLPPSLQFNARVANAFFGVLRRRFDGSVALEPRHASWFEPSVDPLLVRHRVARAAADPARVPAAGETGGFPDLAYVRLHGSPRIYYSTYDDAYMDALAARIRELAVTARDVWCIFDNTTLGAATANALGLIERLRDAVVSPRATLRSP